MQTQGDRDTQDRRIFAVVAYRDDDVWGVEPAPGFTFPSLRLAADWVPRRLQWPHPRLFAARCADSECFARHLQPRGPRQGSSGPGDQEPDAAKLTSTRWHDAAMRSVGAVSAARRGEGRPAAGLKATPLAYCPRRVEYLSLSRIPRRPASATSAAGGSVPRPPALAVTVVFIRR